MEILLLIFILVVLAVFPAWFWGKYIYNRDKNKESKKLLIKIIIFGMLSTVPAVVFGDIFELFFPKGNTLFTSIVYYFVGVALIEEICKFLPGYVIGIKGKEFDEIYDAIVYMSFSALGFAVVENILYILYNVSFVVALKRCILSVPGHIFYGALMGYFIGNAYKNIKNNNKVQYHLNILYSILVPTLVHGFFDFGIIYSGKSSDVILFCLAILLDLSIIILGFIKVNKVSLGNQSFDDKKIDNTIGPKLILILLIVIFVGWFPKKNLINSLIKSYSGIEFRGVSINVDKKGYFKVDKVDTYNFGDEKYIIVKVVSDSLNNFELDDFSLCYVQNKKIEKIKYNSDLSVNDGKQLTLYYDVKDIDYNKYMLIYKLNSDDEKAVLLGNDVFDLFSISSDIKEKN